MQNHFSWRRQKVLMGTTLVTRQLEDIIKTVNSIKTMAFPWDYCLACVSICETDNPIHTVISDTYLQTWIFLTEYKRMSAKPQFCRLSKTCYIFNETFHCSKLNGAAGRDSQSLSVCSSAGNLQDLDAELFPPLHF